MLNSYCVLQDVIDLRDKQGWQARRKVEGPKRIEDIHKEARMEQQRARMAPPPDRRDRRDRMPERPAMPMCASPNVLCFSVLVCSGTPACLASGSGSATEEQTMGPILTSFS